MFHKMINTARDRWYGSDSCTIRHLVDYIVQTDKLRDAQIEAIKTYLFLKIGCDNKPLAELFTQGTFNSLNLSDAELSSAARTFLTRNAAAAALFEYACFRNDKGAQVSEILETQIKRIPESIDYAGFFNAAFYGVSYADYLFSLPMGAGKTYLMAAFIYLDLYFASNEPHNPVFAHNFMVFAPSGLKSSVVPSLRTIQRFDSAWVIPEPAASDLKRNLKFEVLDQGKTANRSNKTKNPNVQKIANHQPFSDLFGLIAVTNAEKVILDRIQEKGGHIEWFEESEDDKDRNANELRNLIGRLPKLSIFIDEVHHAVSDEIKLRSVVNKWAANGSVNSVIGFSGTPYLEKAEKRTVTDTLSVSSSEISNIVYYYPLVSGLGNFLKKPTVRISYAASSEQIIEDGVREFLDTYIDTRYDGGLTAKLGIYCGTIEKLEHMVFPLVSQISAEYGLPADAILRFHKGNKEHPEPSDGQFQFDILDKPYSKIRIVLLVQIGKEGWDCRSLTGIILSQEGDCPRNMVLQTSCRCLRQVVKDAHETALIYLGKNNEDKLNAQLKQQHHITLKEFSSADYGKILIKRYDRTEHLRLPPIEYYQFKVSYDTVIVEKADPLNALAHALDGAKISYTVKTQDMAMMVTDIVYRDDERGTEHTTFMSWLYGISKSSFGFVQMAELLEHEKLLFGIWETITFEKNGTRYFSSNYDRSIVERNIRISFCDKRTFNTREEPIPQEARLLNVANFMPLVNTDTPENYYPDQKMVENIILDDAGKLVVPEKIKTAIEALEAAELYAQAETLRADNSSHRDKDRSFHYLPYKTGSGFEEWFLENMLILDDGRELGLEIYYNGDRSLTEFRIRCYKQAGNKWNYIGMYTPDFLIVKRRDGMIHKAVIVETKGRIYAHDPKFIDKRKFMAERFTTINNDKFGYNRFDYLYLEDSLPKDARLEMTRNKIRSFFR